MTSALRGEGVPLKADIVSNLSRGGCVNLRTGGGGKKSKKNADVIYGSLLNKQTNKHHINSFCPAMSSKHLDVTFPHAVQQLIAH